MKKFINKVLDLKKSIKYSKNSIVSKILYRTPHIVLTLFALDKNQSIAEHVTPFDAMVHIIEGEAELTIGGKKKLLVAGESIIMPADIPHALHAKKAYKMLLSMMKG